MKIENILRLSVVVSRHNFCCHDVLGIGSIGAAGITSAANIAATKMNNKSNERNVDSTNQANRDIARDVNNANMLIAEKNNQTAIDIHREDNEFNAAEAQKQREWDSIGEQRKRMIEAGYNPLMVNGFSDAGGSAASASSAPALDTPVLDGTNMQPSLNKAPDLSAIGDVIKNYVQAEYVRQGANYNKELAEGQKLKNLVDAFNVDHMEDRFYNEQERHEWARQEVEKRIAILSVQYGVLNSQSKYNDALTALTNAAKKETEARTLLYNQNYDYLGKYNEKQLIALDEQIDNIRKQRDVYSSQIALNYSNANLADEQANLLDIDSQSRDEKNKAEIDALTTQTIAQNIANCDAVQKLDMSSEEKQILSTWLAEHPKYSVSQLVACMKDVKNCKDKEYERQGQIRWNKELWNFAKAVVVGGVVGLATGNPMLGVLGGAAAYGAPVGAMIPTQQQTPPIKPFPNTTIPNLSSGLSW